MSRQEQINKIRSFLGWFEDNFADESYLMEEIVDDVVREKWISYLDHPEYLAVCEAVNDLEEDLANHGS